jgi:hypothetical protein
MLHDRHDEAEVVRSFEKLREQLARARQRVSALYPGARIRWAVHIARWLIVDPAKGVTIESSESLDSLAAGHGRVSGNPPSGTHRKHDDD